MFFLVEVTMPSHHPTCPKATKVLYENYVPVSLDAQMRNARGETGGMGPEGQWRTEAGKSSKTKCHASLKLWEASWFVGWLVGCGCRVYLEDHTIGCKGSITMVIISPPSRVGLVINGWINPLSYGMILQAASLKKGPGHCNGRWDSWDPGG